MKGAVFGLVAAAAQYVTAQPFYNNFYGYPYGPAPVYRGPVAVKAPEKAKAPKAKAPKAKAPKPRSWRYDFSQSDYNLDYIDPKVQESQINLYNQIQPGSFGTKAQIGSFSNVFKNDAYQTRAEQYDQKFAYELAKGADADRSKLRNYDLQGQVSQIRADKYLLDVVQPGNTVSNYLDYDRHGVETERQFLNFIEAENKFRRGDIDRYAFERARQNLDWAEEKEQNNLFKWVGNAQLKEYANYNSYNVDSDQADYAWDLVDEAEYKFRSEPTRENSIKLELAELKAQAKEAKSTAALASITGNTLLKYISKNREQEYNEEAYDLAAYELDRDYTRYRFQLP